MRPPPLDPTPLSAPRGSRGEYQITDATKGNPGYCRSTLTLIFIIVVVVVTLQTSSARPIWLLFEIYPNISSSAKIDHSGNCVPRQCQCQCQAYLDCPPDCPPDCAPCTLVYWMTFVECVVTLHHPTTRKCQDIHYVTLRSCPWCTHTELEL